MSDLSKLSDFIDQSLNEFGSMSLKRLNRVGKALEKKILKGNVVDIDDFEKVGNHIARVKSYVHRVQPRAKAFRKKVSGSVRAAELSAFIDLSLVQFADRSRDPEGRYTQGGNVTGVDDFRAAHMPVRRRLKKRVAGAATAAAIGVGGLYAATKGRGRGAFGAARSMKKVFGQ
jgi:hypothetical protein